MPDTKCETRPELSVRLSREQLVEAGWNVMAHAQKPDFVFRAKRTSPFKSAGGRQFSRLLAAEVCASAVVMLDTQYSEVVWRVLATHSIRQFPLHFSSRASPCAITFQLASTSRGSHQKHVLYKGYSGEPAWKAIGDRLQRSYYLSRVNHDWKIGKRRQRTANGKYSFVNTTIQLWNKLPMSLMFIGPCIILIVEE